MSQSSEEDLVTYSLALTRTLRYMPSSVKRPALGNSKEGSLGNRLAARDKLECVFDIGTVGLVILG